MRHHVNKSKKLGKGKDHRRKLLRTLASSVILYEKIETTTANAKAVRGYVDRMVTKAKKRSLHGRRQLIMDLTAGAAKKAAEVLADRYADRNGGYTRIQISGKSKDGMNKYLVELV